MEMQEGWCDSKGTIEDVKSKDTNEARGGLQEGESNCLRSCSEGNKIQKSLNLSTYFSLDWYKIKKIEFLLFVFSAMEINPRFKFSHQVLSVLSQ
ncbi:hypothetical protein GBA52_001665 [Prunus armeniaca]|nr:hypothetical protein GBA52_001665 [Prunus armeniaca]